eukprot:TRINITY_DN14177_c0_g1_i1.p2 TRINITY_DN14177_c0_g1~~TRINITY_DN14177_c0_g1_i1.p2  ORF type:complete len:112 (+),score=12.88 TRINITY_DN14177_c0_g1_i1:80-415(+)
MTEDSISLLHIGCSFGRDELVQVLLDRRADPNSRDASNRTALQVCQDYSPSNPVQQEQRALMLQMLHAHGADCEVVRLKPGDSVPCEEQSSKAPTCRSRGAQGEGLSLIHI